MCFASSIRYGLLLLAAVFAFAASPAMAASSQTTAQTTQVTKAELEASRPDVNINQASAGELAEALVGVGPAKAKAIVAYRKQHGAFSSLADLAKVKGIGEATLAKNKAHILF